MSIEEEVYELLKKYHLSITTAESCTGGMIASTLIDVPGISEYLKEAYITYSNEAKEKLLGVSPVTIEDFTVVSMEVAKEMAAGGKNAADTDICVSATGIAGPDGGTKDQPVGLVYLGCACGEMVNAKRFVFEGSRSEVRKQATVEALKLVKEMILKEV